MCMLGQGPHGKTACQVPLAPRIIATHHRLAFGDMLRTLWRGDEELFDTLHVHGVHNG